MSGPLRFAVLSSLVAMTLVAAAGLAPGAPEPVAAQRPRPEDCLPPPQGIVAWWPFDSSSSDDEWPDLAGYRNNAVPVANGISVPSLVDHALLGQALHLDGTNGLQVRDQPELSIGHGGLTADAWIRIVEDGGTGVRPIVDKRIAVPEADPIGYALYLVDGRLTFSLRTDAASPVEVVAGANDVIADGGWHFVAVAADWVDQGDGTLVLQGRLYVDGSETPFQSGPGSGTADVGAPLFIGTHGLLFETSPIGFHGDIDELELVERALSAEELSEIRTKPAAKCKPQPLADCPIGPKGPVCQGVNELVNVDAGELCSSPAMGFRFTLDGFALPVTSVNYTFSEYFDTACAVGIGDCNPFSPSPGIASYDNANNRIALAWNSTQGFAGAMEGTTPHFGYTVNHQQSATTPQHTVTAAWLLPPPATACAAVTSQGISWTVAAGNMWLQAFGQSPQTIKVAVANRAPQAMGVQAWLVASPSAYALDQLVTANPDMATVMRLPAMARQILAPEEALVLEVPMTADHESALAIVEWRDADTPDGVVSARVFSALPLAPFRSLSDSPTPVAASATATATEVAPEGTATPWIPRSWLHLPYLFGHAPASDDVATVVASSAKQQEGGQ